MKKLSNREMQKIFEYGYEFQNLEFKAAFEWKDRAKASWLQERTIRTILAMSNTPNGGRIIIGIRETKDKTYDYTGVNETQLQSFRNYDKIKGMIDGFAKPYAEFDILYGEFEDNTYIIINVNEFEELPVTCDKDGTNNEILVKDTIYTRARSGQPSSIKANSSELQKIIRMAADKERKQLHTRGWEKEIKIQDVYDKQISDLLESSQFMDIDKIQNLLSKIRNSGYWYIRFYPTLELPDFTEDLKRLSENSAAFKRGWSYPHIPRIPQESSGTHDVYNIQDGIEAWVDFSHHKEVWRLFNSRQFVHFKAVDEDWTDNDYQKPYLGVINAIYTVTEIFMFLRNLCNNGLYEESINVEIVLFKTLNRQLVIDADRRGRLRAEYRCRIKNITLFNDDLELNAIIDNYDSVALKCIMELFQKFNWDNAPESFFKKDQKDIIRGFV